MEQESGIKTWQWVVTVIIILVLVWLGYYMFKGSGETPVIDNEDNGSMMEDTMTGANRVIVSDQFPGNIVYLSSVQLEKPGFVVIHKDNNGELGAVVGSQYFDKGINPGKVTLNSSTVDGEMYYAVLYSDDGDKIFDITKDTLIKDDNGNIIMKPFRSTATITETKG